MAEAGAGMVELGIPFSDPIAESSVIQSANIRALKSGTYLNGIFSMIENLRKTTDIPVIFHSYINPVFNYGYENFFKMCAQTKVVGIVIPDLPYEEKSEIKPRKGNIVNTKGEVLGKHKGLYNKLTNTRFIYVLYCYLIKCQKVKILDNFCKLNSYFYIHRFL